MKDVLDYINNGWDEDHYDDVTEFISSDDRRIKAPPKEFVTKRLGIRHKCTNHCSYVRKNPGRRGSG